MSKRLPKEFKDDVVRVARSGRLTREEVAHDFNISLSSLKRCAIDLRTLGRSPGRDAQDR